MIKHVCDICGKIAFDNDFVLPARKRYSAMKDGKELAYYTKLEQISMDLCFDCMQKIADMIDKMRI